MSCVLLSQDANPILKKFLISTGHKLIEIKKTASVYDAINSHADIYVCKINHSLVISPAQLDVISPELEKCKTTYTKGQDDLGFEYPQNIRFNAYCTDKYIIHNLKYTDTIILENAKQQNLSLINVSQGYTKCNIVEINNHSLITSDVGIEKALKKYDFDVLLISPGHVLLGGFEYGFLGGTSGKVDNKIIFNGDLSKHPEFDKINDFIKSKGFETVYFKEYPLTDIGSIIEI